MLDFSQWQFVTTYLGAAHSLKQDDKLPDYILALTKGTLAYEQAIKAAWIDFKRNPTEANATKFAEFLKTYSGRHWPEVVKAVLGVPELSPQQQKMLEDALGEHHEYVMTSLLPDVLKAASADNLNAMDHRAIFLYAGALWSFGLLATVMFDGLEVRDLADLFLFAGPNDDATCRGERGCEQYAGKVFTVAQILAENIIPGRLRCVTNCRHMLLPIASPLNKPKLPKPTMEYGQWQSEFKHLAGRHDQKLHNPHKVSRAATSDPLKYTDRADYARDKLGYGYSDDGRVELSNGEWKVIDRDFTNDEFWALRRAEDDWDSAVLKAISRGDIQVKNIDKGIVRLTGGPFNDSKYYNNDMAQGRGEVIEMPRVLYHVTTAWNKIDEADGLLLSRADLRRQQKNNEGLGGGSDETISFTDDKNVAINILATMKEARAVASGEIPTSQLLEWSIGGRGADKSYAREFISLASGGYEKEWKPEDPLPQFIKNEMEGVERKSGFITPMSVQQMLAKEEGGRGEFAAKEGYGHWEPDLESALDRTDEAGNTLYTAWKRKLPEAKRVEHNFDLYKYWLAARDHAGGPEDPLFWGTDANYLANLRDEDIALLTYRTKPGSMGIQMGGLKEWRTWDGNALDLEDWDLNDYREDLGFYKTKELLPRRGKGQSIRFMVSGGWPTIADKEKVGEDIKDITVMKHLPGEHDQLDHGRRSGASQATVSRDWLSKQGVLAGDYGKPGSAQDDLANTLSQYDVSQEDLAGLRSITDVPPDGYHYVNGVMRKITGAGLLAGDIQGVYNPKTATLHISPTVLATESGKKTLLHEIGHHVSQKHAEDEAAYVAWERILKEAPTHIEGTEFVRDTSNLQRKYGLRERSLDGTDELLADSYMASKMGSKTQKAALEALWQDAGTPLQEMLKHLVGRHDQRSHGRSKEPSGFDYTKFWEDQPEVVLYHGTTRQKLGSILKNGLLPSSQGHTAGASFLSTSPKQAKLYAGMGGEVESGGYITKPDTDRVVLEVRVSPTVLKANSHWLKTREAFAKVQKELEEDSGFLDYLEDSGGEFETHSVIYPDKIKVISGANISSYKALSDLVSVTELRPINDNGQIAIVGVPVEVSAELVRATPWYYLESGVVLKHLPGRHDQHTHASRPGGSAFGNAEFPEEAANRRYAENIALHLAESTGLSPEKIYAVMKAYDFQPAANTYAGSAIVEAVSRVFGVELSDYEKQKIADRKDTASTIPKKWIRTDYKVNGYSEYDRPLKPEQMDRLVTQIYEDTQAYLRDRNITELTLYRGDKEKHNNVLMSYTTDIPTAEHFGTLITDIVPAEHVLSLPMTGFGVSEQYEVTVLKLHEEALKHLPGRHNQKSHGRQEGGSSSGLNKPILAPMFSASSWDYQRPDTKAADAYLSGVKVQIRVTTQDEETGEYDVVMETMDSPKHYEYGQSLDDITMSDAERRTWKNSVVSNLATDTGMSYDRINELVGTWARTANDNDPTSLGLQMAAHEEFGVPLTKWQRENIEEIKVYGPERRPAKTNIEEFEKAREDGHKFLRAMYNRTQEELKAAGIDEVLLYRGSVQIEPRDTPEKWRKLYSTDTLNENAMGSWSLSYRTANAFAHGFGEFETSQTEMETGFIHQALIPRERILSMPKTGAGCLTEFEYIVLGSDVKDEARIVGRYQGD